MIFIKKGAINPICPGLFEHILRPGLGKIRLLILFVNDLMLKIMFDFLFVGREAFYPLVLWYFWWTLFFLGETRWLYGFESVLPFSKLIILGKDKFLHLPSYTQIWVKIYVLEWLFHFIQSSFSRAIGQTTLWKNFLACEM